MHTAQEDTVYVSSLTSGNVKNNASSNITTEQTMSAEYQNQNQSVQSQQSTEKIDQNRTDVHVDIVNSSSNLNSPGGLSSGMQNMQIISDSANPSLLKGPFEVIGQTETVNLNEITSVQILDSNGIPMHIPIQVLAGEKNSDYSAIHLLSVEVDDVKEKCDNTEVKVNGQNLHFHEPCLTSTPARHLEALNDTIVAGHIVHPTLTVCDTSPINGSDEVLSEQQPKEDFIAASPVGLDREKKPVQFPETKQDQAPDAEIRKEKLKKGRGSMSKSMNVSKKPRIAVINEEVETKLKIV